jgi:hypothetical protein
MNVFSFDSSAWVKLYVAEAGSSWVNRFWSLGPPCACSGLGYGTTITMVASDQELLNAALGEGLATLDRVIGPPLPAI